MRLEQKVVEEQFRSAREHRLAKDWTPYQSANPIASDLHDCERYQTMRLVAWDVKAPPDARGLEVMEDGRELESRMIRQLEDEGHEIVEQQAPFEVLQPLEPGGPKVRILSGRMDGKIRVGSGRGDLIPVEFKSTSEYTVDAIDDEADLIAHSEWTRKWWRQCQVYMLGGGYEQSLLVLGFRGVRKVIVVNLDYDEAERILKAATHAVLLARLALEEGIGSDKLDGWLNENLLRTPPYHHDRVVCGRCPFFQRACHPPQPAEGARQLRPDLGDEVARLVATRAARDIHERAKKVIKAQTEGYDYTIAGDYVVQGRWRERTVKAQAERKDRWWEPKVVGSDREEE